MLTERSSGSTLLSDAAYCALASAQAARGTEIDERTQTALKAVIQQMAVMLQTPTTNADQNFYLSSLDPGKGKSEAVCKFLQTWRAASFSPTGGVLVAVSRLEEIEAYIDRSGLGDIDYAVLVAEGALVGGMGRSDRNEAPVLFTTHEMIRRRCRGSTFGSVRAFHFQGHARTCRIWDEAMILAQPATVRLDAVRSLLEPLRPLSGSAAELVEKFIDTVAEAARGETIVVPQALKQWSDILRPHHGNHCQRWHTLIAWAGTEVVVDDNNYHGRALVGTHDRLPDDFAPALILDASGRVRHTYRVWEETGVNLVRLPSAPQDYRELVVHHWDRSCSRSTFDNAIHREEILQVAADLINQDQTAEWLVIHHIARDSSGGIKDALAQRIVGAGGRVSFLNWGAHHGSNDYRHITRVLVLGLWHLSPAVHLAHHLAAAPEHKVPEVTKDDRQSMAVGEHQHNLLQAICRASVRNGTNGTCGPCVAYVIGSIHSDGHAALMETFPGTRIEDWRPREAPFRGQAKLVVDALGAMFGDGVTQAVRKETLRKAVGFQRSQELAQVMRRPDVQQWMEEQGLISATREIRRAEA